MKRPATKIVVAAVALGAALVGVAGVRAVLRGSSGTTGSGAHESCGAGFFRVGTRCCASSIEPAKPSLCAFGPVPSCPRPLVPTERGCDAPLGGDLGTVLVPATSVTIGPSDWEAEGRVAPRVVRAGPFRIDRFEGSAGRFQEKTGGDPARAASSVTLDEARAMCKERGGRLPSEDEWIVAASGDKPRRYPWGDTGAVCRRAAWGLVRGPCGTGATGPDTVGAHPDGATPLGIHDLAGNVAEWVETGACAGDAGVAGECLGVVRGGSYDTDLATDLRTWVRREVPAAKKDPTIGFRCAYDVLP